MENYNLEILLEKANKASLGIRSRQTGITLKEFFLNQKQRVKNILTSQKKKVSEGLKAASDKAKGSKKAVATEYVTVTNKAGKKTKQLLGGKDMIISKVFSNFRKIVGEIYNLIKDRCNSIERICNMGIRQAGAIIKGRTDIANVTKAKEMKVNVKEYNGLLNDSLADMRGVFAAFHRICK